MQKKSAIGLLPGIEGVKWIQQKFRVPQKNRAVRTSCPDRHSTLAPSWRPSLRSSLPLSFAVAHPWPAILRRLSIRDCNP